MSKLTEKERDAFVKIVEADLTAVHKKMQEQIYKLWHLSREELIKRKGLDVLMNRKEELQRKQKEIQEEIQQIENELKSEKLSAEEASEFGGKITRYGDVDGAQFYEIPINSKFDYEIAKLIKDKIELDAPAKFLYDLARSSLRAIAMSGTFEEARDAYAKFYSFDFRQYGVDIPPKLDELASKGIRIESSEKKRVLLIETEQTIKNIEQQEKIKKEEKKVFLETEVRE